LAYEATVWSFAGDAKKNRPGVAKINVNPLLATPHVAEEDLIRITKHIRSAKASVDVLAVSVHFGAELTTTVTPHQKIIAHTAIDAGADMVIGHHPHILQGIEAYKKGLIFYSLGNLVFDEDYFYPDESMLIKAWISPQKIKVSVLPIRLDEKGNPSPLEKSSEEYSRVLQKVRKLSEGLGVRIDEDGFIERVM